MVGESLARTQRAPAVVLIEEHSALGLRPVRRRDRIRARLRTTSLDEQLAAGRSPDRTCRSPSMRHGSLTEPATAPSHRLRAVALAAQRPRRTRVADQPEERPARRGRSSKRSRGGSTPTEPIDVSGIARVRRLLADGGGPLYRRTRAGPLQRELMSTLERWTLRHSRREHSKRRLRQHSARAARIARRRPRPAWCCDRR